MQYLGSARSFAPVVVAWTVAACGLSSPLSTEPLTGTAEAELDASMDETEPRDAGADPVKPSTSVGTAADAGKQASQAAPCGSGPGCDPTNLGGETCNSLGLGEGQLLCDPTTCQFVVALCKGLSDETPTIGPPCGTGPGCDPSDLGDETCTSLGMGTGVLSCDPVTCMFDTSMCSGMTGTGGTGGGTGGTGA